MTQAERVHEVTAFGFTERQARFLVTVLLHAGVCLGRQYCTFSGIARGQVMHDFFKMLVDRDFATAYPRAHGRTHLYHIHAKALYAAIGEPNSRFRRATPLARAVERVMLLDAVLAEAELTWLATEREKVSHFTRQTRLQPQELPHLTFGKPPSTTVRYFPDKLPIGVDSGNWRHVFVYLSHAPAAGRFSGLPASSRGAASSALSVDDSVTGSPTSRWRDSTLSGRCPGRACVASEAGHV